MFACGQNCGVKPITCVIPTGISTAEKTRLNASNAFSSRTRPVALRTNRSRLAAGVSAGMLVMEPPLDAVFAPDGSAPRGSPRRATHDELDRELPPGVRAKRIFDQVDGEIRGLLPEPRERLADRRERRRDERGDEAVVEPDDRDPGRNV